MIRTLMCFVGLLILSGCTDGPLYQMKRINPYYRAQWEKDKQLGPTFVQRMDELRLLQTRLPAMEHGEQVAWADRLERIIASDPSPEFRSRAAATIALVSCESTVRALNAASTDSSEKVRLVACSSWRTLGGEQARDMLLTLAGNSGESTSVRQAAIEGLSDFNEPEVRQALANLLDDPSPAIQYQTTRSLTQITGRDYGGDLQSWRQYLSGQEVSEPETSLTAISLEKIFFWR